MKHYSFRPVYDGGDEISVSVDDELIITRCNMGMDWVGMMTNRYGVRNLPALTNALAFTHMLVEEDEEGDDGDADEEVAQVDIEKADTDKRQVFGWAYVSKDHKGVQQVDISGEMVEPEELEKAAYRFVLTSRSQGDLHQRITKDAPHVVGTMIESVVVTPEKIEKWGLEPGSMPTGWWVGFQVNDDTVWEEIKAGRRRQFSIHGKGQKKAA